MPKSHGHLHSVEPGLLLLEEALPSQISEKFTATDEVQYEEYPMLVLENKLQVHQKRMGHLLQYFFFENGGFDFLVLHDYIFSERLHCVNLLRLVNLFR